jgi:hypothetical protein
MRVQMQPKDIQIKGDTSITVFNIDLGYALITFLSRAWSEYLGRYLCGA